MYVELVAIKTGKENVPNVLVNLLWSTCQLIVYTTMSIKYFLKMSLNFAHDSNLTLVRRFHTEKNVKMC
jgi:hypothetical protein